MNESPRYLLHGILYYCFFLLLFCQFPISHSLPGKIDTWFYVNAFDSIQNYIDAFIHHSPLGTALYPEANLYTYGNYSFGQALFFLPFKWMGMGDVNAYYFFISIVYALNAMGARLIVEKFGIKAWFAFFSGLIFADSNYAYSTLDNPDVTFISWGLFSIYFLLSFFERYKSIHLIAAFCMLACEIYYSSYGFLFAGLFFAIITLYHYRSLWDRRYIMSWALGAVCALLIIYPYLHLYIFNAPLLSAYNPAQNISATGTASLKLMDIFRPMKFNIYYPLCHHTDFNWIYKTRSAFLGIVLPVSGVIGIYRLRGYLRWYLITGFILFFVLSWGPFLPIEHKEFPSPIYWLYSIAHINQYVRISVRAYFFCVLILSIGAGAYLQTLYSYSRKWSMFLIAVILIENTPFAFEMYRSQYWIDISARTPHYTSGEVIANLPSSFYSGFIPGFTPECIERQDYEFEFIREYLYMYQQTIHKANTINGFVGFIPASRINNQLLIYQVENGDSVALKKLIQNNKLTHIVWQKRMLNGCDYSKATALLDSYKSLTRELNDSDKILYRVINK